MAIHVQKQFFGHDFKILFIESFLVMITSLFLFLDLLLLISFVSIFSLFSISFRCNINIVLKLGGFVLSEDNHSQNNCHCALGKCPCHYCSIRSASLGRSIHPLC